MSNILSFTSLPRASFILNFSALKMSYATRRVQKVMVQPINFIFRLLQSRARVVIWLKDIVNERFEGIIVGFDEFMNIVLEDTIEMNNRTNFKRKVGTILLKGENVTLIQSANPDEKSGLGQVPRASTRPSGDTTEQSTA